ncbi:alpha/beta fold hydrolase [Aspergillus lucknowensis]|uniref:Alpha/Beta hydrolase protein n=1 Tax=Aspergillus lucknowensis TaxID=176173 RepID=A0ABR4LCM7_9EURO
MAEMSTNLTHHEVTYTYSDNYHKKIHYLASGPATGPLIIFVHGWPGSAITWKWQLEFFAARGFRAIAPDMPGYGRSTARHVASDYSQESLVEGAMMALLAHTGRTAAIWVGHDWGAGVTSSVATQHPETVRALVNLCVPFGTIERGWAGFLPLVNRERYPAAEYEYGQWDYMKKFEEDFEDTVAWFERDIPGFLKLAMQPTPRPPEDHDRVEPMMSRVRRAGWLFGSEKPPGVDEVAGEPLGSGILFDTFVGDVLATGIWPGAAYYLNHERNAAYNGGDEKRKQLTMPVLFVHAAWDLVCDTVTSRLAEPMRAACCDLTEETIEAGHAVHLEQPDVLNAAVLRFLAGKLEGR